MSHEATNWAIKQRGLAPPAKIVLWHLCDRYHPDNGCFPSQDRLAEDCEISRASLNTHLKALEEAGLIRREQRRDKRTRQQKSTFYRFAFEADFKLENPPNPSPDIGHGNGAEPVSKSDAEPCPNPGESRVQNLDTNPVRGTSKRTSNEREGARDDQEEENQTMSVDAWKRRFRKAHKDWPTFVSDSADTAEAEWFNLSEEDRQKAGNLMPVYIAEVRKSGRTKFCAFAVYLREKRWERLPATAVQSCRSTGLAARFGKMWGAVRMVDLMREPYGHFPPMTIMQQKLIEQGGPIADRERLERKSRYGWPKVNTMHERAIRKHAGVSGDPSLAGIAELFGKVAKGSPAWDAWKSLHVQHGWPWFGVDRDCPDWVWLPEPPRDPESYFSPQEAVSAAMARFEMEHASITERQAAE